MYAIYGNKIDALSGKALFDDEAWKKANNVLKEILQGFVSDPPGYQFYTKKIGFQWISEER